MVYKQNIYKGAEYNKQINVLYYMIIFVQVSFNSMNKAHDEQIK